MTSRFSEVIVDCHDPQKLADFWRAVLDYQILETRDDLVEIGAEAPTADGFRRAPLAPTIVFVKVPEGKAVKNRVHIDVSPIDASQPQEVERVLALGAKKIDIGQGEVGWVVLADPEGNEFCILRSLAPPLN
jgi:hypothetical protein